jgi:hypothetical protein
VLQDVHWSSGYRLFTYALGNLISAQLWEDQPGHPDLSEQIRRENSMPCWPGCVRRSTATGASSSRRNSSRR